MNDDALPPVAPSEGDQSVLGKDSARQTLIEQRRRLVAESLQVGNLGNNARDLPDQADPSHECQIVLSVEDIRPYEHNPRRTQNARFDDIKASIRASGLRNPFTVTRRPGESHFVVEAGGNTRLLAIRQLWAETREPRFHKLAVLFRPWRSESHVLTAHLIENDQRGDMSFWDKASGVVALKARLEAEQGTTFSLRQLDEAMKALGLAINTATLAHFLFATERLATLGEVVVDLSGLDVKLMQPRLNGMKRYAQTRASLAEDDLYATVFEPVFRRTAEEYRRTQNFSAAVLCQACEEALAEVLEEPVVELRKALDPAARSLRGASASSPAPAVAVRSADEGGKVPPANDPSSSPVPAVSTANTADPAMAASGRHDPARDSPRVDAGVPVLHSRIIQQARMCARLAGIGDCLRDDTDAPQGFSLDALPAPVTGEALPPSRQWAWHLLALVSAQLDTSASTAMPNESTAFDPAIPDTACRAPPPTPAPFSFDAAFFAWLVDADDPAATACWDLLALVREARGSPLTPDLPGNVMLTGEVP
ncbi:MAG: ParB N-terminal domain-containing protein [Sulfuritalea sp.]|nr:ParB N-terminal domain-containing protein [Sulfuritalea sp.]